MAAMGGAITAEMPDSLNRDCNSGNSRPAVQSKAMEGIGVKREVVKGTHLAARPGRMV